MEANMDKQVKVLKAIANDVGSRINKGYLPRALVWESLCLQVRPSANPLPPGCHDDHGGRIIGDLLNTCSLSYYHQGVQTVISHWPTDMLLLLSLALITLGC
jgi:hypothetical protein